VNHVDSHQDEKARQLSIFAKLNIDADSLATQGLSKQKIPGIDLPSDHAILLISGKKVASHHVKYF
jgi:hypothetical protein